MSFFPLGTRETVGWLSVKGFSVIARLGGEAGAGFSRVHGWRETRDVLLPWGLLESRTVVKVWVPSEHNELAIRSPNGYGHPMHIRLQDHGLWY